MVFYDPLYKPIVLYKKKDKRSEILTVCAFSEKLKGKTKIKITVPDG